MLRKYLWLFLVTLFFATVFQNISYAGITGKIAGRLIDKQTGEPLPGGNVVVVGMVRDGKEVRFPVEQVKGAATDLNGEFYILNLPPGQYIVEASYMGYEKQVRKPVRISADYTTRLDFQLSQVTLELGEEVVVTAKRERIRKDLTSSAVSVSADQLQSLPVREVSDVLELQAGVVRDAGGQLHIRGGRSTEIVYLVDGIQVIDPLNRQAGISIDNQAVQELQAITGTFNAEYGQALSGVINIVTKQGSDDYRFNFIGYLGDFLSFDDKTYYVMDNPAWARFAAHRLTNQFFEEDLNYLNSGEYDFQSSSVIKDKPYLKKKGYLNTFNPLTNTDLQFNTSGPIPWTKKRVTYFISGRYYYDPDYTYGKRYFMPWGFSSPAKDTVHTFKKPDDKLMPLSWAEQYSLQSKLYFRPVASMNFSYGLYLSKRRNRDASNRYKYVPDATKIHHNLSQTHVFSLNHTLSPKTFYELKISYFQKDYHGELYDDPYDYRYMPTKRADFEQYVFDRRNNKWVSVQLNNSDFVYFGNDVQRWKNKVKHWSFKWDMTSQVTNRHLMKWGFGGIFHDLYNEAYTLQFDQTTYRPYIPDPDSSAFSQNYHYKPREFSAYVQDKIEFQELIINLGLRFDYFDSDGKTLADPADPEILDPVKNAHRYKNYDPNLPEDQWGPEYTLEEREQFWYKKPKPKYQLSPRFGISFPITSQGVIHFSYGWFFQNPELRYLYENPKFWVDVKKANVNPLIGNADIGPERTVMYEVGLQQGLWDRLFLNVTGFYRDIRDWVGISAPIDTYWGTTYHKYINYDHAAVKGITFNSQFALSDFSVNLDYTFMIAKGTYSNPQEAYTQIRDNKEPRIQLINLDWDQRHTLNATFGYQKNGWNASMVASLNSGFPYTPSFYRGETVGGTTLSELKVNSEVRPTTFTIDLRISRRVKLFGMNYDLMLNVYNLLDTRNARTVYSDTGRPDVTFASRTQEDRNAGLDVEISDVKEYYTRPGNYYPPRFIQLGIGVGL
ncbi:MAG: TonB-dependent receptor [Calditrichaeota bacterium]|nr:TonB-dependent receptor [Calditrichota bacterium]